MDLKRCGVVLAVSIGLAQSQTEIPAQHEFEVVSIKPNKVNPDNPRSPISCSAAGRFVASNVPAEYVIGWAYVIMTEFSVPTWASSGGEKYNIEARAAGPISLAECRVMVQHMLADRFHLILHTETRDARVYFLTVEKGASKLRELKPDSPPAGADGIFIQGQKIGARAWGADALAAWLGSVPSIGVGIPVVDKTELKGRYQFSLDFTPGGNPDIFEAVQEQLGLRLEPGKAPVKFTVVDHLERPSEN